MPKIHPPLAIYAANLPLLLVIVVIALRNIPLKTKACFGLGEVLGAFLGMAFLVGLYIMSVVFIMTRTANFAAWKHRVTALVISTALVIGGYLLITAPPGYFRATIIFKAASGDLPQTELLLHDDGTYTAIKQYADWSCRYSGTFVWKTDTLLLRDLPLTEVTRFSETWVQSGDQLFPIVSNATKPTQPEALKITKEQYR